MLLFQGILFLIVNLVFASKESKKCARELEGVVYVPDVCAYKYLRKITDTLRVQSPLLWTDQAQSVIRSFELTFNVRVGVLDAFGTVYDYPNGNVIAPSSLSKTVVVDRAYALGEGFGSFDSNVNFQQAPALYVYGSQFWNPNGEMYVIAVALNKTAAPEFC